MHMCLNVKDGDKRRGQADGGETGNIDFGQDVRVITAAIDERKRLHQDLTKSEEEIRQMQTIIKDMANECREDTNEGQDGDSDFKQNIRVITAAIKQGKRYRADVDIEQRLKRDEMEQNELNILRLNEELAKTKEEHLHMKMSINAPANQFKEQPAVQGASTFDFKGGVQPIAESLKESEGFLSFVRIFCVTFCLIFAFFYLFRLYVDLFLCRNRGN